LGTWGKHEWGKKIKSLRKFWKFSFSKIKWTNFFALFFFFFAFFLLFFFFGGGGINNSAKSLRRCEFVLAIIKYKRRISVWQQKAKPI
jgi:hypothetical protein